KISLSSPLNKIKLKKRAECKTFTTSLMKQGICVNDENERNMLSEKSEKNIDQMGKNQIENIFCQKNLIHNLSNAINVGKIEDDELNTKHNEENNSQQQIGYHTVNTGEWRALDHSDNEIFCGAFNKKREGSYSRRRTFELTDYIETSENKKTNSPITSKGTLDLSQINNIENTGDGKLSIIKDCLKREEKEKIMDIGINELFENQEKAIFEIGERSELEKGDYQSTNMSDIQKNIMLADNDMKVDECSDILKDKERVIQSISIKPVLVQKNDLENRDVGKFSITHSCSKLEKKEKINDIVINEQLESREKTISEHCKTSELDYHTNTNMPEFHKNIVLADNDMKVDECNDILKAEENTVQSSLIKQELVQRNELTNRNEGDFSITNGRSQLENKEKINDIGISEQLKNKEKNISERGESSELEKEDYHC
ncbi:unnamed protein product, partial [Meganyctiphanes norvegica]